MKFYTFDPEKRQANEVEYQGFFHGAHEIAAENGEAEIEAQFDQKISQAKQLAVRSKKQLEGRLEHLNNVAPEVESNWQAARSKIDPSELQLVMPPAIAIAGASALATDVVMLAPSLDLLGITNPS